MKKILIIILIAILLSGIFIYFTFHTFNKPNIAPLSNNSVAAFQIGVYHDLKNAQNAAHEFQGLIVSVNDTYHVYVAFCQAEKTINLLKSYYDDKNISYYLTNININTIFLEHLNKYEILLQSTSSQNYSAILNEMLKDYQTNS